MYGIRYVLNTSDNLNIKGQSARKQTFILGQKRVAIWEALFFFQAEIQIVFKLEDKDTEYL